MTPEASTPGSVPTVMPSGVPRNAAILLVGLLGLLALLEATNGTRLPLAATISALIFFAGLCVVRLEAAFAILLALTPFSVEAVLTSDRTALMMPTEPMLLLALAAWGMRFMTRRSTRAEHPRLVGWLLFGLITILISIGVTDYRLSAVKATANVTWYALFGLFILNNFAEEARLRALRAAWMVPGLIITLTSLAMVATGHYSHQTGFWWTYRNFTEHGSFAAYLCFPLAVAGAFAMESSGMARAGWLLAAGLIGLQVILSMTRGAWLGAAALFALLGLIYWRQLLRPPALVGAAVALVGLLVVLYLTGVGSALKTYTETTSQVGYTSNLERVNRWYAGWHMFRSHPVTGVGFGTYLNVYREYRRLPLGTDQSNISMGVHSEYLKVLAETGLLGATAAAGVLLTIAGLAWRAVRRSPGGFRRGMAVGATGGLLTYLVHGFVNNYLVYDKAAVPVWTCIGTLGAIVTLNRRGAGRAPGAPPDPGPAGDAGR